mgnify:FL=1
MTKLALGLQAGGSAVGAGVVYLSAHKRLNSQSED